MRSDRLPCPREIQRRDIWGREPGDVPGFFFVREISWSVSAGSGFLKFRGNGLYCPDCRITEMSGWKIPLRSESNPLALPRHHWWLWNLQGWGSTTAWAASSNPCHSEFIPNIQPEPPWHNLRLFSSLSLPLGFLCKPNLPKPTCRWSLKGGPGSLPIPWGSFLGFCPGREAEGEGMNPLESPETSQRSWLTIINFLKLILIFLLFFFFFLFLTYVAIQLAGVIWLYGCCYCHCNSFMLFYYFVPFPFAIINYNI